MKKINNYILEKLKINKDSCCDIISDVKDIITDACKYFNVYERDFDIRMITNTKSRFLVNNPSKCHALSLFFPHKTIKDIEKNKPFIKFLNQLKAQIEKRLLNYNESVEVRIVQSNYDSSHKIHVILP